MNKIRLLVYYFAFFKKNRKTLKKVLTYVLKSSTIQNVTRQIVSNMN